MTREEFRALAQDYAAGAMTEEERAAFETSLPEAEAHGWSADLADAMNSAALLVRALPPEHVSSHVWRDIERAIGNGEMKTRRASPLWAAAVLAIMVAAGLQMRGLVRRRVDAETALTQTTTRCKDDVEQLRKELEQTKHARDDAESAVALAADAHTRVVSLQAHDTELNVRVLWNETLHRGVVVASGPAAGQGKDYELWVIRGDEKIAAGLIHPVGGRAVASLDASLVQPGADVLAVTLEASGGGSEPHGPIILAGKI